MRWPRGTAGGDTGISHFAAAPRNLGVPTACWHWPLEHYVAPPIPRKRRGWASLGGAAGDAWRCAAFTGQDVADLLGPCLAPALASHAPPRTTAQPTRASMPAAIGRESDGPLRPTQPREKVDPDADVRVLWGNACLSCRPCYDGRG